MYFSIKLKISLTKLILHPKLITNIYTYYYVFIHEDKIFKISIECLV